MNETRKERTVGIGLSGGTDSTAAAMLLLEAGYDVVGYTMLTTDDSEAVVAKAAAVADKLGIDHRTIARLIQVQCFGCTCRRLCKRIDALALHRLQSKIEIRRVT